METSFISFRYKKPFKSNWGGKQHWLSNNLFLKYYQFIIIRGYETVQKKKKNIIKS